MNIILNKSGGEKKNLDFINKFKSISLSEKKMAKYCADPHLYIQGDEFAIFWKTKSNKKVRYLGMRSE